ncbi:MAG TPA: T9SS type A sorting domain-containing protein, partial [Bacteroidales bacterium]|nr:T9SS type A sorting domain-containing protein [Bacteroidales bacterium]
TPPWDITVLYNSSSAKEINNIRSSTYTLKADEPGFYTLATVEDAFARGSVSGTGIVRVRNTPTASLSGNGAICGDASTTLNVNLTGTPPWKFTYRVNSETPVTIDDVSSSPGRITARKAGTYTLLEVYDQYCDGTASGNAVVTKSSAPDVSISGLAESYSQKFTEWIPIEGSPSGGEFSGSGVLHYQNVWYFLPALAEVGNNNIVYKYRQNSSSCFGYDTVSVRIFEVSAEILFTRERTGFCLNDPPFEVSGINMTGGGGTGNFEISGGQGLTDHGDNTATVDPSLLAAGQYTITYTASDGTEVERSFEIGEQLKADFVWGTECYNPGQPIHFTNTSVSSFGFLGSGSYLWNIYGKTDSASWSSEDISYNFPEPGNYTVTLKATNSHGCTDTAVRVLWLQPVVELAGENYFEDFEDPTQWQSANAPSLQNNSWQLGTPERHGFPLRGFSSPFSGQKCWYTDITENPVPEEESWITSPCFDFTGTQKPTFVAKIWRSFADNRDGAGLQYSTDNGRSWNPVGSLNDGINWFNSYYGDPGEQTIGWTAIKDTGWVETRHALDFLADEPQVMFRIHYHASGDAFGNDGIAIDDIQFVERNRNLLIEHFTNSSDRNSAMADSILYEVIEISGTNIIDLQYHTAEPAEDPMNLDNPVIPSTRQFYYSVSSVPYTMVNGGTEAKDRVDYVSGSLDPNVLAVESLYDSDFKLEVYSMIEGDSLYAQVIISAVNDVPLTEISVRIAVLESLVDDVTGSNGSTYFRNVVKTMLPDAAGTALYKEWTSGEWVVVTESWGIENVYDSSTLRVAGFIQDEITQEIYQAELDTRGLVTGTDDPEDVNSAEGFDIFPNPAKELIYIKTRESEEDLTIEVINNLGSTVHSSTLPSGVTMHELPVDYLPDGMYLLRIKNQAVTIGSWKVIIAK